MQDTPPPDSDEGILFGDSVPTLAASSPIADIVE